MNNSEAINSMIERRSIRKYRNDPVSKEALELILKAASYAPTARDRQERHFTVVSNGDVITKLTEALKSASHDESVPDFLASLVDNDAYRIGYGAPDLILISGDASWGTAEADCTLAAGNIMLAAHALRLGSCWINQPSVVAEVPKFKTLLTELGVPEAYRLFTCICLGFADGIPPKASERKPNICNFVE